MSLYFGHLFIKGCRREIVEQMIREMMSKEGYEYITQDKIPPRYPAEKREFAHLAVGGPDINGVITILFQDWDTTFARALFLTKNLPSALMVAVVKSPTGSLCCKAYRGGDLVIKIGDDPDTELFYNPVKADSYDVTSFLAVWKGESPVAIPDRSAREGTPLAKPSDLLSCLDVWRIDCRFEEAINGKWQSALTHHIFINRRSRLFLEM